MTLLEQLTPERIGDLYDRLGAKPITGVYVKEIGGQLYCCPLGAIACGAGENSDDDAIMRFIHNFPSPEASLFVIGYENEADTDWGAKDPYFRRGQELRRYLGGQDIPYYQDLTDD